MKITDIQNNGTIRTLSIIGATVALALAVTIAVLLATGTLMLPSRQAEIAARGAAVMPFDLEKTQHIFTQQPTGGVQQVIVRDPSDTAQIALIRQHLQEEAEKFQRGDFADPTSIHGALMPGLDELRSSAGRINLTYSELTNGAEIRYATSDQTLVTALHRWFEAQTSDHGQHATQ